MPVMTQKAMVPVALTKEYPTYRDANTFPYLGSTWREFLERWNNPDITLPEALGLLHRVPSCLPSYFRRCTAEEVTMGTADDCVRFLLHYAGLKPVRLSSGMEIVEKAREVLLNRVLNNKDFLERSSSELLVAVMEFFADDNHFPHSEPGRRNLEKFVREARRGRANSVTVVSALNSLSRRFAP